MSITAFPQRCARIISSPTKEIASRSQRGMCAAILRSYLSLENSYRESRRLSRSSTVVATSLCRPLRLGGRCRPVCGNHLGLGEGRLPEHWSVNELPLSWCGCCSGHEIRTSSNVVKVLQESKSSVPAEALHIPAAALALQGEKEEVRKQL